MTNIVPRFNSSHPYWNIAVDMRQRGESLQAIVESAVDYGYTELTYRNISTGLRKAPADLHLPVTTAKYLRRKFGKLSEDFNSLEEMKLLSIEAQSKISEIEEDLDDPDLTISRRMYLEGLSWRWYGRAYDWTKGCADIVVKMTLANARASDSTEPDSKSVDQYQVSKTNEEVQREIAGLKEELIKALPSPDVLGKYGHDNVRLPNPELEAPEEDEEI